MFELFNNHRNLWKFFILKTNVIIIKIFIGHSYQFKIASEALKVCKSYDWGCLWYKWVFKSLRKFMREDDERKLEGRNSTDVKPGEKKSD